MGELADIRRLLLHVRLKLTEHLGNRGLTIDGPEFPRKIEELNHMNQTLGLSVRDLKSAQHAAAVREKSLWNIPRDKRYGPAASVADQQREIKELIRETGEIQGLVEKLLGSIRSGDEMEGVHTAAELIGKATEHDSGAAEQALPSHHGYTGEPCALACESRIRCHHGVRGYPGVSSSI